MVIAQTQKEIEAARELIRKSELKSVRLHRCHAELQGDEEKLKAPFGLAQSHNAAASLIDNLLRVEVAFTFQSFDASDGKVSLFSVQCSFDVDYILKKDYRPEKDAIDAFKDGNAVFNCWPYARECLQSITSRMSLRPPPLPLLKIVPAKKIRESSSMPPETTPVKSDT